MTGSHASATMSGGCSAGDWGLEEHAVHARLVLHLLNHIPSHVGHILSNYLSIYIHPGCFNLLVIVSNPATNVDVQISV